MLGNVVKNVRNLSRKIPVVVDEPKLEDREEKILALRLFNIVWQIV
jgi:predicted membrane chloride channel (bestrophin family)